MIWGQEDITVVNIYAPNTEVPKYIKQKLTHLEGKINNTAVIAEDFQIQLSTMDTDHPDRIAKEERI